MLPPSVWTFINDNKNDINKKKANLTDTWRLFNPDVRRYTWRQNQPVIHCRLVDFFLVSESSLCDVTHADILPGFKTDHSMITLNVALHSNPRGNGFWKLLERAIRNLGRG